MIAQRKCRYVTSNNAQIEGRFRPPLFPAKPPAPGIKVGDNESFYTTFLHGTVGILSLDALDLSPAWDGSSRNLGHAYSQSDVDGESTERPLLEASQWQRLSNTLEKQVGE